MNVFVLSPGRSGSTTVTKACDHLDGWTAGHESRARELGAARFDYPPNHVESDNRLSFLLGRLFDRFGDDALYVHLRRDPEQVAQSYNKRWTAPEAIMPAYQHGVLMRREPLKIRPGSDDGLQLARDYVLTVNANVTEFLRHRTNPMTLDLEHIVEQFPDFLDRIGATGDWNAIERELRTRHNASTRRASGRSSRILKHLGGNGNTRTTEGRGCELPLDR